MKAIKTHYIGPTNTKGSRIRASDGDINSITIPYDSGKETDANHISAAVALCRKMNWSNPESLVMGWLKDDAVFVFPPKGDKTT